jgi:hypothetical protein
MFCNAPRFYFASALIVCLSTPSWSNEQVIRFDMSPNVPLTPVQGHPGAGDLGHSVLGQSDLRLVQCELRLSSLIASPSFPRIDQWLVRCQPRDMEMRITDYAPRTEIRSEIEGPIQIKVTDENTQSLGLSVVGDYGKMVKGNLGAESANKNCVARQYNAKPAVHAVKASGTIDGGRGVYFKLRWTATQVLDGEKKFTLTMQVPPTWRGGLIDVDVVAQTAQRSFGGFDTQIRTLGEAKFVVATYLDGDKEATQRARAFSSAEQRLRKLSLNPRYKSKPTTLPSMLRHVAAKLDLDSAPQDRDWVRRLTRGEADPYLDREISRLPMEIRVAAIDYHDKRMEFNRLGAELSSRGSERRN